MWFTKDTDGYRAWFTVEDKNGIIRTGGVAGNFTATVVEPGDTASTVPTVTESTTKAGLYTFLIPSSFFATYGVGGYGVVVEVNFVVAPKITTVFGEVLRVFDEDFDSIYANVDSVGTAVTAVGVAVAAVAADVMLQIVDGAINVRTVLSRLNAMARGRITLSGAVTKPAQDAVYFDEAGSSIYTNRNTGDERNPL